MRPVNRAKGPRRLSITSNVSFPYLLEHWPSSMQQVSPAQSLSSRQAALSGQEIKGGQQTAAVNQGMHSNTTL